MVKLELIEMTIYKLMVSISFFVIILNWFFLVLDEKINYNFSEDK